MEKSILLKARAFSSSLFLTGSLDFALPNYLFSNNKAKIKVKCFHQSDFISFFPKLQLQVLWKLHLWAILEYKKLHQIPLLIHLVPSAAQ